MKSDLRRPIELSVSLPTDARFAETARDLAAHAARHAGWSEPRARTFGEEVGEIVRRHAQKGGGGASVPLVVRLTEGTVELLVDGRTFTLDS